MNEIKEIFLKVSDCVEHKASVIPIEVTGNICFFKYWYKMKPMAVFAMGLHNNLIC